MNEILFKNADPKIIHAINKLQSDIKGTHFENHVFVVGGCVKDLILTQPIKDIDIAVDIDGGGMALANYLAAKNKCWVGGKNPVIFETYGTAKMQFTKDDICKDVVFEFVQTKKNQIHVSGFKDELGTIQEDALGRDLTINSIYYNVSSEKIIDPTNGIGDLGIVLVI